MTRIIKFRAWWVHKEYQPNGKMFNVGAISFAKRQDGEPEYNFVNNQEPYEVALMDGDGSKFGWNNAKECELMQFTGLKDKNGKEIYEKDIVTKPDSILKWQVEFVVQEIVPINLSEWEVIGNVFESPELLTPKQK